MPDPDEELAQRARNLARDIEARADVVAAGVDMNSSPNALQRKWLMRQAAGSAIDVANCLTAAVAETGAWSARDEPGL